MRIEGCSSCSAGAVSDRSIGKENDGSRAESHQKKRPSSPSSAHKRTGASRRSGPGRERYMQMDAVASWLARRYRSEMHLSADPRAWRAWPPSSKVRRIVRFLCCVPAGAGAAPHLPPSHNSREWIQKLKRTYVASLANTIRYAAMFGCRTGTRTQYIRPTGPAGTGELEPCGELAAARPGRWSTASAGPHGMRLFACRHCCLPAPMHPVSVRRGPGSGRIWPVSKRVRRSDVWWPFPSPSRLTAAGPPRRGASAVGTLALRRWA